METTDPPQQTPAASPVEPPETGGPADEASRGERCGNCEAPLHGPFCSSCGQHAHESARSMGTLLHDAWHVLTHLDGRLWGTLGALAFRPGVLTREYLDDRRARFLPPFRLYLVLSLAFFALFALSPSGGDRQALALAEGGSGDEARARLEEAAKELEASGRGEVAAALRGAARPDAPESPGAACAELAGIGGERIGPALARACERSTRDGGRALGRAFLANVPKAMFLFLPVVALVLFLLFGRSRRYYVEHLVTVLHLQSALFLLLPPALLASLIAGWIPALGFLPGAVTLGLWAYATWYAYRSLRVVYGEGRALTAAKLVGLGVAYLAVLGLTLGATALWSAFVV